MKLRIWVRIGRCLAVLGLLLLGAGWLPPAPLAAEDASFESDGLRIRYQIDGQGPPVVLIHGYSASGDTNWRLPGMIAKLSPDFRVITIDNRGHGLSDKPEDATAYGHRMADDVVRLLDRLQIERAHLAGYSMGGMIVLKVAATHPERMLSGMIGGMGWTPLGPILEERPTEGEEDSRRGSAAMRACGRAFPDLGITREELAAIRVPLTVVIGENDGLLERRVRPLEEVRPDIPVVVIPKMNHINCSFNPQYQAAVRDWLLSQAAAR